MTQVRDLATFIGLIVMALGVFFLFGAVVTAIRIVLEHVADWWWSR
jgi:hypothetical protein